MNLLTNRTAPRAPALAGRRRRGARASIIFMVLWVAGLVGMLLVAFLSLMSAQNNSTMRSQAWNRSLVVAEAGIEDALAFIHQNGVTNTSPPEKDGWIYSGAVWSNQVMLGECGYRVLITNCAVAVDPVIYSYGYAPIVQHYAGGGPGPFLADAAAGPNLIYLGRGIRVETARITYGAGLGIISRTFIDVGNKANLDSYDSRTAPDGVWSTSVAGTNAYVGANGGNIIGQGGGKFCTIHGEAGTSAGGIIDDVIVTGKVTHDLNIRFPPVSLPVLSSPKTPTYGTNYFTNIVALKKGGYATNITSTVYEYYLHDGHYWGNNQAQIFGEVDGGNVYVRGSNVLWWVRNDFHPATITIETNSHLTLYVGDASGNHATTIKDCWNGAAGSSSTRLTYYGLPSNTSIIKGPQGTFGGYMYAPTADYLMNGNGPSDMDFMGSLVVNSIVVHGATGSFHVDMALKDMLQNEMRIIVVSWSEINPVPPF